MHSYSNVYINRAGLAGLVILVVDSKVGDSLLLSVFSQLKSQAIVDRSVAIATKSEWKLGKYKLQRLHVVWAFELFV